MKIISLVLLLVLMPTAWAEDGDLLLSRWAEDAKTLHEGVIKTMREEYAQKADAPLWHEFNLDLLERIRHSRNDVQPYSYDIMRKLTLSMSETFGKNPKNFSWRDAARYLEVHMHLTGEIIKVVIDQTSSF